MVVVLYSHPPSPQTPRGQALVQEDQDSADSENQNHFLKLLGKMVSEVGDDQDKAMQYHHVSVNVTFNFIL